MVAINKIAPYNFIHSYNINKKNYSDNNPTKLYKNDEFVRSVSFKGTDKKYNAHIPEGSLVANRIKQEVHDLGLSGSGLISLAEKSRHKGSIVYEYAKDYLSYSDRYEKYDEYDESSDIYERKKDGSVKVHLRAKYFDNLILASEIFEFDKEGKLKKYAASTTEEEEDGTLYDAYSVYWYDKNKIPHIIYENARFDGGTTTAESVFHVNQNVEKYRDAKFSGHYENALKEVYCNYSSDGTSTTAEKKYLLPGNEKFNEYEGEYENYIYNHDDHTETYDRHYIIDKKEE